MGHFTELGAVGPIGDQPERDRPKYQWIVRSIPPRWFDHVFFQSIIIGWASGIFEPEP